MPVAKNGSDQQHPASRCGWQQLAFTWGTSADKHLVLASAATCPSAIVDVQFCTAAHWYRMQALTAAACRTVRVVLLYMPLQT